LNYDLSIFHAINGGGSMWLDWLFLALSAPISGFIAIACILVFIVMKHRRALVRVVVSATLAVSLSDFVGSHLIKPWIARVRPLYLLPAGDVRVLAEAANVGSMPSLHTANSFAVAYVLTMLDRRLALIAYPAAILVGVSRIYVGAHWPGDIAAGAAWGTVAGLAGWWLTTTVIRIRESLR